MLEDTDRATGFLGVYGDSAGSKLTVSISKHKFWKAHKYGSLKTIEEEFITLRCQTKVPRAHMKMEVLSDFFTVMLN